MSKDRTDEKVTARAGTHDDESTGEGVLIGHPWWDGYNDCEARAEEELSLEEAGQLHAQLGAAIAVARERAARRLAAGREARGEAIDEALDGILGRRPGT
jgi:hypothetical protein